MSTVSNSGQVEGVEDEETAIFKEAFDNFDKDKNGHIDIKELGVVMRSLGFSPTEDQLKNMVSKYDDDEDGVISLSEFISMMKTTEQKTEFEEEIAAAFEFFDSNHDGNVTADELADVMRGLGNKLSEDEIQLLLREADSNGDGSISLKEFISFMYST